MSEQIKTTTVDQLPDAANLNGFYAFGYKSDSPVGERSVKVSIALLKGNKGDKGDVPLIGANGNWWVGGVDTGVSAQGDDGDTVANKVIYNVSQANNKYNYTTNTEARNALLAADRALGQLITYKLGSGKWITEQYIGADVSGWGVVANWKYLGGLQAEDIHQLVDITTDKPISPNGVLKWVEGLGVVGYKETTTTTPIDFTNLIDETNLVIRGTYINSSGVVTTGNNDYGHNPDYFAVKPDTEYLTNVRSVWNGAPEMIMYDANKNFIGSKSLQLWFKTLPLAAFIRYNIQPKRKLTPLFLYQADKTTTEISDIPVLDIGVKDLNNAIEVDVPLVGSILPLDLSMSRYYLNELAELVTSNANWFHSDFFPVKGGVSYEQNTAGSGQYVKSWFYDGEKRPIHWFNSVDKTAVSPRNARFVRISHNKMSLEGIYFRDKEAIKCVVIPELYVPQKNILTEDVSVSVYSYIALGDSLTSPGDSYAAMLSKSLGVVEFKNLAISGISSGYLLGAVDTIADGYNGLVTVMIGANDTNGTPIGNIEEVLNKKFEDLVNGSSYVENYRIALETLMRKAPAATIIVMPSLSLNGKEVLIEKYRDAARKVSIFLALPCSDMYRTCGISPPTYGIYTNDGYHPNAAGHAKLHKVLLPFVKKYL